MEEKTRKLLMKVFEPIELKMKVSKEDSERYDEFHQIKIDMMRAVEEFQKPTKD